MKIIPQHIVLLPDGNRRWARKRGLPIIRGHQQGYENLTSFYKWCKSRGIKVLTAFGFSTENWKRPKYEVRYLMKLLERGLSNFVSGKERKKLQKEDVKIKIIGQKNRLPLSLQKTIREIETLTQNNTKFRFNLAVSYGGRWDIIQAIHKIVNGNMEPSKITEQVLEKNLSTGGLPSADLIIRSGGEKRLSNFLLWQAAYAELYFSDKLWPDFTEADLDQALEEYASRTRRFGH